jgi:hypothetical protein
MIAYNLLAALKHAAAVDLRWLQDLNTQRQVDLQQSDLWGIDEQT